MLVLGLAVAIPALAWQGPANFSAYKPAILTGTAAALLVLMFSGNVFSVERIRRFFTTGPNLAILLFLGWTGLTWFDSSFKSYGLQMVLQLFAGAMIYFAVVYRMPARRNLQKLNGGLIAGVIASVGVAALLFARQSGGSLPSAFGNTQLFAGFLVVTLPMLIVAAQTDDNPKRKMAAQVGMVVAVAALLLTQVRTSWIAALVGVTVLGVLALRTAGGTTTVARQKHQVLLPALLVVGAFAMFFLLSASGNNFLDRLTKGGATTFNLRQDMWAAAWQMFVQRPLEGWGIGSYAWFAGYLTEAPPSVALWRGAAPSLGEMAHNQYLQLLAETGVIGLGLYAAVLGGFFARCARALREKTSPTRRWMIIAAIAAMSGQMVDALANPAWQIAEVSLFFWLIMGMGVAATRPRAEREEAVSLAAVESRPVRNPFRLGWGVVQVAALAVVISATGQVYADHPEGGGGTVTPAQNEYLQCIGSTLTPTPVFMDYPAVGVNQIFYTFTVQLQTQTGVQTVDASVAPETTYEILGGNGCIVQGSAKNLFTTGTPGRADCLNQSVTIRVRYGGAPDGHVCTKDALIVFSGVLGQGGQTFGTAPGPGPDIGGDDGGGGAGLIIGGLAGAGLLFFLLGRRKKKGKGGGGGDDEDEGPGRDSPDSGGRDSASLPKYERITSIRTSPSELLIQPVQDQKAQKIHVLVQLDGNPKWYDVTDHKDTDFKVSNGTAQLVSTQGNQEQYRVQRDRLAIQPLKVVASFRGLKAETKVNFLTP